MTRCWGFVARASAIGLLLLAISPLTNPFSTLDLATLAGQAGAQDSGSLKTKPSTEGPLPVASLTAPPVLDRAAGRSPTPPTLTDRQQIEQRVLRL
jgi:hypothetical protein